MRYRERLPLLDSDRPFLADGGIETSLIFHQGIDLPCFAAFTLLRDEEGRAALRSYFEPYVAVARERGVGMVLDTATWRANPDWAERLGYSPEELDAANRAAVALAEEIRTAAEAEGLVVVVNGAIGPRGDGYDPAELMSGEEAELYHSTQIGTFADAGVDMVAGVTITHSGEAIGIVRAAHAKGVPAAIAFTVETDGRLPSGQLLRDAIEQVDAEAGDAAPVYYMVSCAHPTHFAHVLEDDGPWLDRIGGIRANASRMSHAELDEAEELDDGDPVELGRQYGELRSRLRQVKVVGGCCGTDHRHVAEACAAWSA